MADAKSIEKVMEQLHWLGHDAFRLDTAEGPVYFDPFQLEGQRPPAKLILVTHDHYDHCVPDEVARLQGPDTVVVTEADSAAKLSGDVRVLAPGDELQVAGFRVAAVPAYNTDKEFHPKSNGWLGFMLNYAGVNIYHAGDTDHIPEMKDFEVDIALLPVSGTYVMTADQAVGAALAIRPAVAVPMHYGAIVGSEDDAERFAAALAGQVPVKILQKES